MRRGRFLVLILAAALMLAGGVVWGERAGVPAAMLEQSAERDAVQLFWRVKGTRLSTVEVNDTAGLVSALRGAAAGDVIRLAPGVYSDFSLKGVSFDSNVTITSADPANRAVLADFTIARVVGVTFTNLEFATPSDVASKGGGYWAFNVLDSRDIHFDRISVHGSLDNDASNDVQGISIRNSSHVSVTNSEFQQLERALAVGSVDYINVSGNNVHDLRSDGFDFAEVSFVEVRGNVLSDFHPVQRDHPDAIQFWTGGTTKASHDIVVAGNVILRGDGEGSQGIFFRDQTNKLPFERVTISDNLLVNTGYNAIATNGMKGVTISNNVLITNVGADKTWLLVRNSDGVVATGNRASSIGFDNVKDLTDKGNTITKGVTDLGSADIKAWLQANPSVSAAATDQLRALLANDVSLNEVPPFVIPADFDPGAVIVDVSRYSGFNDFLFL